MKWLLFIFLAGCYDSGAQTLPRYSFQKPAMGSLFSILIYSADSSGARSAAERTFGLIDSLNLIYSDYIETSELNRLASTAGDDQWVKVSSPLYEILLIAVNASKQSKGSFDITVAPLTAIWRRARKMGLLPDTDSVKMARSVIGYRYISIDTTNRTIKLLKKGMRLDLGGIAKGATAQKAIDYLQSLGYPNAMIDAGGDIVAGYVPAGTQCWRIGINYPGADSILPRRLCITGTAVTTSGDLYQYLQIGKKKYSHIIDPRSGKALTRSRNVTVIAPKGVDADWLTKACSILPIKQSMKLISGFSGAEVQIAALKKGKPVFYRSPGFEKWFE